MPFPIIPAILVAGGLAMAARLGLKKRRAAHEGAARARVLSHSTRRLLVEGHKVLAEGRRGAARALEDLGRARMGFWSGPMLDFARGYGPLVASGALEPPADWGGPSGRASGYGGGSGDAGAPAGAGTYPGSGGGGASPGSGVSGEGSRGLSSAASEACGYALRFERAIAAPTAETGGMVPAAFVQLGALGPRLASDIVWLSRQDRVFKGYFNPTVDWLAGILPEKAFQDGPGEAGAREDVSGGRRDAILGGELPPWLALSAKSILRAARAEQGAAGGIFGRGRADEAAENMEKGALACRGLGDHAFRVRNALEPLAAGLASSLAAVRGADAGVPGPGGGVPPGALEALRGACLYAAAAWSLLKVPLVTTGGAVDDRSMAALREAEISSPGRPDAGEGAGPS